MLKLAKEYPNYGWVTNKGYPTREHIASVLKYGACAIHRKTFLRKIYERSNQIEFTFTEVV